MIRQELKLGGMARKALDARRSREEAALAAATGFGLHDKELLAGDDDSALDPAAFAAFAAGGGGGGGKVSEEMLAGFRSDLEQLMAQLKAAS